MPSSTNIEAILERQAKFAELSRRLTEGQVGAIAPTLVRLEQGPWISVSRQLGSGGTNLAQRLGQGLGWQVFDREILTRIAETTETRETVLSWMDEQAVGPMTDYLSRLLDSEVPGRVPFLKEMVHVVVGLARQGHAVIVGRGSNWFLDARYGLRVRVVAPPTIRVENLVREAGLDVESARRRSRENDEQQRAFIRQAFQQEIDDPMGYDLVLNTGSMKPETAVATALAALEHKLGLRGRIR